METQSTAPNRSLPHYPAQIARQRRVPSLRRCGQRLQLRDGSTRGSKIDTSIDLETVQAGRREKHYCPSPLDVSGAARRSSCRNRRVAAYLDLERTCRTSPIRCRACVSSSPSEYEPPTCAP